MIAKFNLYDFISNLIPGVLVLWCVQRMGSATGWHFPFEFSGGLPETSLLIVLGYVSGLMLQAVAERFTQRIILLPLWGGFPSARYLLPDDGRLSKSYKDQIRVLITERFKVSTDPDLPDNCSPDEKRRLCLVKNEELFALCYEYVDSLSGRPLSFTAQYGMFRGLLTAFLLLALWSMLLFFRSPPSPQGSPGSFLLLAAFYAVLAWLCYVRCKRRSEDFARTVYALFVSSPARKQSKDC